MRRALPLVAALVVAVVTIPAGAYPGAPWFEPSQPYRDNFPDPSIVRDGDRYYAYGTSTGGAYLPVMTSTDLRTWVARPAYRPPCGDDGDPYFNDALPCPAPWAPDRPVSGRLKKEVWAPGAARVGGRWVVYYTVKDRLDPERYCLSVASSSSPLGPFVDSSSGCFHRDDDPKGSIDPQPFVDDDGTPYLLWKSEGVPGSQPTRIWMRRLSPDGLSWAAGSSPSAILATSQPWEGSVVENPSMVRWQGRLYLFYSANEWRSSSYAIGYADCAAPLAPCRAWPHNPVLASRGDRLGPGGPSAFVDTGDRLVLGHHWWNAPYTDYPAYPACDGDGDGECPDAGQRRLGLGLVYRTSTGLAVGGPPPPLPRAIDDSCPAGVPEDGFADVPDTNVHERAVDCMVWWRVARGKDAGYDPSGPVTRGQMASFLARLVLESGGSLPERPPDAFPDDEGSPHEESIDRLAAAGVVAGRADGTYGPGAVVDRGQMATFVVRAYQYRSGRTLPGGSDVFVDDDGATHEPRIDQAALAGFTGGRADGSYGAAGLVRRDQMASFLARVLDLLVERGEAPRRSP